MQKETIGQGFKEEIAIKPEGNVIILTTTKVNQESFVSHEEALRQKKAESNRIKDVSLSALGIAAFIFGTRIVASSDLELSNYSSIAKLTFGGGLQLLGLKVLMMSVKMHDKAQLASRQLKRIRSAMGELGSKAHNPK